jgi:CBS domain containing-hemolysin-like protein
MIWIAVTICLIVSFIFSGIEAGIFSVNRVRLRHRAKLHDPAALQLNRLLSQPERLLVTVLITTNLMNIFALTLITQEGVRRLGNAGYALVGIVFLPIYLIGLELLPKSLFRRFPYRALAALCEPLRLADLLLAPLHFVGRVAARLISGRRPLEQQKLFVAREDFKYLTIESERTGTLSRGERQLIHNVVDFRAVTARDVMVPIAQVRTISGQALLEELLAKSEETRIDRWPVTSPNGEIVGLVSTVDIVLEGRRSGLVESFQRRIVKVAPGEPAYSVLRKLRAARVRVAAVLESGGEALGIVTWEDLIKRLVHTAGP